MTIISRLIALFIFLVTTASQASDIHISSLSELAKYAGESGHVITMEPGVYKLTDYLISDSISARRNRKVFQYITFSGSNNVFNLKGVEIELDTKIRTLLNPPIHSDEFLVTGSNNEFVGLTIRCVGNGTSPGGTVLQVAGESNVLKDITLHVAGSYPYGYGDLFGKGKQAETTIKHRKHSGLLVTGNETKLYRCKVYSRSFGHCFFIQQHPKNVYFEDCYAEGEVRTTDAVLAETSGPAFDVNFKTWTQNREGEYVVTPGYMKSLCEDGFRTYGICENITFKNCTAKNTRGGFELRFNSARLEDCTTIGTERAYWIGDNTTIINSKGDANYGPLLFVEGSHVDVELRVDSTESDRLVHSLITVLGADNKVVLKTTNDKKKQHELPILIGYTPPLHGESMSPYSEAETTGLELINETGMPLKIGKQAKDGVIKTNGNIIENNGVNVKVSEL
ncbi:hypothetical protein [Formosa algae]|uniref:Right handed beta helix domain-containing protein n=1 Tax=Formosa algae TaxID=225843 RepID=A0A9X0YME5_9FLAO|nr:hypothetical protein [Formosa algae]MBP1841256.1 hypothetical protein [Formosa algae]MDQ0336821.1 hypothetical protein [Formosa algae]